MIPQYPRKLAGHLRQVLNLNKARTDCFSSCTPGAIIAKSVCRNEKVYPVYKVRKAE